jgi:hypothetical protein
MTITPRRNQPLQRQDRTPDPLHHKEPPALPADPLDMHGTRLRVTVLQLAHNPAEAPEVVVARAQAYHTFLLGLTPYAEGLDATAEEG